MRRCWPTASRFYAVLGNHDDPDQRNYPPFNMPATATTRSRRQPTSLAGLVTDVRVFALDSTNLDDAQEAWLAEQLSKSKARWKIVVLHHPLYTSGRYGLQARLFRWQLESLLVDHGADVVFSGHEHIYQRSRLQRGIQYFITGGAGSLRRGDGRETAAIAQKLRPGFSFHAGRDRRRRAVLPGDHAHRRDGRCRSAAAGVNPRHESRCARSAPESLYIRRLRR